MGIHESPTASVTVITHSDHVNTGIGIERKKENRAEKGGKRALGLFQMLARLKISSPLNFLAR